MTELRFDDLTGRLVLLAPGRDERPVSVSGERTSVGRASAPERGTAGCPFCPEHESETPPEVARTGGGAPDEPGWRVRVVPNLYPIVGGSDPGPAADGAHEVVVLSPDHDHSFAALAEDEAVDVLTVLRERARVHAAAGLAYVQVLLNHGRHAGASIAHPHAQVVALEFVPPVVQAAVARFAPGDDLVLVDHADAADREQLVAAFADVQGWCPSGSGSPFEVRLAALGAGSRFAEATDAQVGGIAELLRRVLGAVEFVLDDPPYNVVLHDAPSLDDARYHWWVQVTPRVATVAGFEVGTGVLVNTVAPEDAARRLRDTA